MTTTLILYAIVDELKDGKYFFPKDGNMNLPHSGPTWVKIDRPTMIQWFSKRTRAEEVLSSFKVKRLNTRIEGFMFTVD